MASLGVVRVWHDEEGWGVIDSDVAPGGCWAHYSSVHVAGYKLLETGQEVRFTVEAAEQDGYAFRALEVWPADQTPVRTDPEDPSPSSAYSSAMTLSFDDDEDNRA